MENTTKMGASDLRTLDKIAIVGMGCRFPGGANDCSLFWENLKNGKDCIVPTPLSRYNAKHLYSANKAKRGMLTGGRGGYIDGFDEFDPSFFGIGAREAECMDPQQRKLLEVAWEALEDGGQKPFDLAGKNVGVFVGGFTLDYKIVQFSDLSFEGISAHTATGTMMTMLSNRLSYCFDFNGPSMSIDTACSSSLVAIHLACQSLQSKESSLALAGGCLLHMTPQYTVAESKGGFLSPEGSSRTFDASANGYVRSEGVGLIVLKRLEDALANGDRIQAVVLASGVNQDGRSEGITSPNGEAQARLIYEVCEKAGIQPGDLQYVEAHGTSTPVGDPIEANALSKVLAKGRKENTLCYVGSVKTNIGHTESAAGIAGVMKVVLSLQHKKIPPHLNLINLNPSIDPKACFEIPRQLTDWPAHEGTAKAGVNSFGFGGTNSFLVLEEAPDSVMEKREGKDICASILTLNASDASYFPEMVKRLQLRVQSDVHNLQNIAYTSTCHRQNLDSKLSFVFKSQRDLLDKFQNYIEGHSHPHIIDTVPDINSEKKLVWVFTGMGPQWWKMGRELFEKEPVYRREIERCDLEIRKHANWSLIKELNATEEESQMSETWLAQPANFALQVALAALWKSYGIKPDAIVGHSTGEAAAFYEAGVYSFEEAVYIILQRSRLQQTLVDTGSMLAVSMTEAEALKFLLPYGDRVSIAAMNSPTALTLSGEHEPLKELALKFQEQGVFNKFLTVRVPYHSAKMEAIREELISSLSKIKANPIQTPLYLTGRNGKAQGPELDAHYWWDNVRDSVRFHAAIDALIDDGYNLFLEVGPHPVLAHSITECLTNKQKTGKIFPSIRRQEEEIPRFLSSLAHLHHVGMNVDWKPLFEDAQIVPLPTYPWKKDRYWTEAKRVEDVRLGKIDHPFLGLKLANAEPTWELSLDLEHSPYLKDHCIQGNIVFPAAAYLEMANQAMSSMTGKNRERGLWMSERSVDHPKEMTASLLNFEIKKALFLSEEENKSVQFSFKLESAQFSIASINTNTQEPVFHASGEFCTKPQMKVLPKLDISTLQSRCEKHIHKETCYRKLKSMGYDYGPYFQSLDEIWISESEVLARLVPLKDEKTVAETSYHMHPILMDGCFQSLLTLEFTTQREKTGGIRLPLSIREIQTQKVPYGALWIHSRLVHCDDEELIGDISIYNEEGYYLGFVDGFRAVDVEKASASTNFATLQSWLSEPVWVQSPQVSMTAEISPAQQTWGTTLVFSEISELSKKLCEQLRQRNVNYFLIHKGETYNFEILKRKVSLNPSRDSFRRLFKDIQEAGEKSCSHIFYLWSLNDKDFAGISVEDLNIQKTSYPLLSLAQVLQSENIANRLLVVTQGARDRNPLSTSFWGLSRVLWQQELQGRNGKLIDFDTNPDAKLLLEEASLYGEDEISYREGTRFVHRLQRSDVFYKPLPLHLKTDASYLVTGAFGALGRLLCRSLIKSGARRLILMGRSTLPSRKEWKKVQNNSKQKELINFVCELESYGAQILLAPVDLTDEQSFLNWLEEFRQSSLPPLRGVFHLAGQVKDTLLSEMTEENFNAAYKPKVYGAYLLHRHLLEDPLDHFVLFASVASLLTTAGQTNYAAANAFLDGLAHYRRSLGLPGISIDWGPWATGMIEELGLIEHYRKSRGMNSLAPNTGMDVLEALLSQSKTQWLVAPIVDWTVFLNWYEKCPPLLADLAAEQKQTGTENEEQNFVERFRQAEASERYSLLAEHFSKVVSDVLRVKTTQLHSDATLNELGLDSLLVIELRARLQREIKVALPVVTLLSGARVEELVVQLQIHLEKQLTSENKDANEIHVVEYTDTKEFPLSKNQLALWFLKHLHPEGFAYNIGGAVLVSTQIDPELMFESLRKLIHRHPSLRANFFQKNGQAVQCISDEIKEDFACINVEGWEWDRVYQHIIQEYRKPYNLSSDALMRFRLYRISDKRWVFMKAVHHIISDAISTFTFIEELLALYEGMKRKENVSLPTLQSTYLDFVNWQNRLLGSSEAQKMKEYWIQHLPEEIPVLNLPADKPRPSVQTHNGASHFFVLDTQLTQDVHALAKKQGKTVFMVLLSAYYTLLHRYSGQEHIIVGSPVTGRTQQNFSSLYGYFVNPLPLHVDLSAQPNTYQLLDQVQSVVLNGLDNQEYPFVMLVDELGLKHDPSRSAVFQAMFILLVHRVATEPYGYRLEYVELPEEEGQFDLTLSAYENESEGAFHCVFKYNSDLFLPQTMQRMSQHYVNLLKAMTQEPDVSVSKLNMLNEREQIQLTKEWTGAGEIRVSKESILSKFLKHVHENPQAEALILPLENGSRDRMTYADLDRESDLWAAYLQEKGLGRGHLVALCLEKSHRLFVSILAVMKSGAAFLPLNPEDPASRLVQLVQQAKAQVVLTDEERKERFKDWEGLCLTERIHSPLQRKNTEPAFEDLAYVIFTSGSTGLPKAVEVTHGNLVSVYEGWEKEYRLKEEIKVHAQLANVSFDVFIGDFARALASGGTLLLVTRSLLFNTSQLYQTLLEERVDAMECVPAVLRGLMDYCFLEKRNLHFIKLLIVGSDAWKVEEFQKLRSLCDSDQRVINSYGLTEATIDSTYFEASVDAYEKGSMVPIGRPFPNSVVYVLDAQKQPVPIGVRGELWIGGAGLSCGYREEKERTAERFMNVEMGKQSLRLYRTGDLAYWDVQGLLHLVGRTDTQVKIHGHRIEVSEVEAQLKKIPHIAEALVAVYSEDGSSNLCAYYITKEEVSLDSKFLRTHLAAVLPTYMIPTSFVSLSQFPLSSNGKIDMKALPKPSHFEREGALEEIQTVYEILVASHWKKVLKISKVYLEDDFFELGGNSIDLIELVYHLQAELNLSISVSQLFKITTLYGMSKTIEGLVNGSDASEKPYLVFNPGQPKTLFCFPPAGGHGLVYKRMAEHMTGYTLISFNYLTGEDKVERYADIISSLQEKGPYSLFGYSLGGNLAFEIAKLLHTRNHELSQLVIMDSYRITEHFEFGEEQLAEFEKELSEHLHKHTGSHIVAKETLEQARDYITFCNRTQNLGQVPARVTVISDEHKLKFYAEGEKGSWHDSSFFSTNVIKGFGSHEDMLGLHYVEKNAKLTRNLLEGVSLDAMQ